MLTEVPAVPAVAQVQVRACRLAAGHRPGLGARVRHLGRRLGPDDELAADQDPVQLAVAVPAVGHRMERRRGADLDDAGGLAHGVGADTRVHRPAGLRAGEHGRGRPGRVPGEEGRVKTKLAAFLAVLIAVGAVSYAVTRVVLRGHTTPAAHASLPPRLASYLGVYEGGRARRLPADHAAFGNDGGPRKPNLVGYFSGWAQPFETSFADLLREHGVTPFVQIDPTYASVSGIAAGDYDSYLRSYADSVRNFGGAVVIGFGHEIDAPWYSWGYGHVPASVFVAAWRHIVTLFRGQGADNVTWLWTINGDRSDTGPIKSWWPGAKYVTWVGIDGYYFRPTDTFSTVFGQTIDQVRALTNKPILLSETAVGPQAGQFVKIGDLFQRACASTRRSAWSGSTSPSTAASTTRTGAPSKATQHRHGRVPARHLLADPHGSLTVRGPGPGRSARHGQNCTPRVSAPSTSRLVPVMKLAAGLTRNAAARAISSGLAIRPVGFRAMAWANRSGGFCWMFIPHPAGEERVARDRLLALMPLAASWWASPWV